MTLYLGIQSGKQTSGMDADFVLKWCGTVLIENIYTHAVPKKVMIAKQQQQQQCMKRERKVWENGVDEMLALKSFFLLLVLYREMLFICCLSLWLRQAWSPGGVCVCGMRLVFRVYSTFVFGISCI